MSEVNSENSIYSHEIKNEISSDEVIDNNNSLFNNHQLESKHKLDNPINQSCSNHQFRVNHPSNQENDKNQSQKKDKAVLTDPMTTTTNNIIESLEDTNDQYNSGESILTINRANSHVRYSKLERTKNQLRSLQELSDYFFCYSWMYDKMATYTYYKNITLTLTISLLSIAIAQSIFSDLTCSEFTWLKMSTASISYLAAFLSALNHFLALPAAYKEYKDWAGLCINNYYEIQHWMIDAAHCKESYMDFCKRMTREYVNLTKKARPIISAKRALIKAFNHTNVQFPPIVGYVKDHTTRAVDLREIIDQVAKNIQHEEQMREERKKKIHKKSNTTDDSMLVIDLSETNNEHNKINSYTNDNEINPIHLRKSTYVRGNTTPIITRTSSNGNQIGLNRKILFNSQLGFNTPSGFNQSLNDHQSDSSDTESDNDSLLQKNNKSDIISLDPRLNYEISRLSFHQ